MSKWTPEKEAKFKVAADALLASGSGDYERLIRDAPKREIELNLPQVVSAAALQQFQIKEWGRGTGKTTDLGRMVHQAVTTMPRSTGLFIVPNYQVGLSHIIPSLKKSMEMFGMYQNIHYFVGVKPPRSWRKTWGTAYEAPDEIKRYITFWNGTGMHLISHDVSDDGRGLNTDWIIGDEAALLDPEKIQENTDPTRRGTNAREFKGKQYFGMRSYVTSTPITPKGKWVTALEEKALEEPATYAYLKATCYHNLHNLRPGYVEEARKVAYKLWTFEAEYLCIRPKFTLESFYPLFDSDRHCYRVDTIDGERYLEVGGVADCRGDQDLTRGVPLIVGVDWGATINCCTINQHLRSLNEFRCLNDMHVLGDDQKIQDDLFQELDDYYKYHDCKVIYLWYDNTGNSKTGNTKQTRAEQAATQLRELGWTVHLMTVGMQNPQHEAKHILWNAILREASNQLPRFRANYYKTQHLQASIGNARTKTGPNGEIKKDKSSEKNKSIKRADATDLSDAMDSPIYGMFYRMLYGLSDLLPAPVASTLR